MGYAHRETKGARKKSEVAAFANSMVEELSAVGNSLVMPALNARIKELFGFDFGDALDSIGKANKRSPKRSRARKTTGRPKRKAWPANRQVMRAGYSERNILLLPTCQKSQCGRLLYSQCASSAPAAAPNARRERRVWLPLNLFRQPRLFAPFSVILYGGLAAAALLAAAFLVPPFFAERFAPPFFDFPAFFFLVAICYAFPPDLVIVQQICTQILFQDDEAICEP